MTDARQSAPPTRQWKSFLLDQWPGQNADGEVAEKSPLWRTPLLALVLFALIITVGGTAAYLSARRSVTQTTHENLEAIARLKVDEIERWLDWHRKDAQLAIDTPLFASELQRWLQGGMRDDRDRERLLDHLRQVAMAGHYRDVGIRAAADGALLLSSAGQADAANHRLNAVVAAREMRAISDDLHSATTDAADIGIDFYFPIRLAGMSQALAVVDIEDNPTDFLFPLMSRWPGSSPSAETLIFRTDGPDVVYLNNPRHRATAALQFHLPVSSRELLAAQAARGKIGPLVGVDYREVPSLGYAAQVTGTNWLMMAKIDAAEAYAGLNTVALPAALVATILLVLAARWLFEHGRDAEARYSRKLERELMAKRIEFLSRYANDTMILTDTNGVIIEANDRSSITFGYARGEMIGMNVIELSAPHLREEVPMILKMITNECRTLETDSLHRDGHVFPVELSLRRIEIDGTLYFQGVVRDITERRDAAARIQMLSRLKTATSETNRAIVHCRSPEEVYRAVCMACVEHGGFRLAWVGLVDAGAQRIVPVEVAGPAFGYIDGIVIDTRDDVAEGQGPSAIAYRERRMVMCNDFFADPAVAPWHACAAAHGLSSSIALPLLRGGQSYGTLSVYGSERNVFDDESVSLLEAMAENISFAIDQFDLNVQRQQAEHALRQSEEKFRTLVENLPQHIFVKNSDSIYVSCNVAYAQALGISPDQIAGMTDYDFYPARLAERYRRDDRRVMRMARVEDIQEEFIERGQQKFIHTIKAPFRNEQGQIVGVLGVFRDITDSKRAEMALRQYAEEVEDLYQNAPCGYHSIDADGSLTRINDTELRWLGYTREEVLDHMSIFDMLSATSRHVFTESFRQFKQTGSARDIELEMVRKDGTMLPVILSATAVFDADGSYISSRTTVYDITERRKLEHDQSMQAKRVEELSHRLVALQEKERQRLAGELHDRASPNLAAIKITLGTLAGALPQHVLADAEASLEDARALLDDTTASIREICAELRPTVLDYAGLVPALKGYAAQFMKRTGITVRVNARQDGARLGKDIESALFRIVQEAMTNCAKHACAKSVAIELTSSDRHVALTVRDDGQGFDPNALALSGNMSGLGLITMRERAEFVGGIFIITSHPLTGTEIRVELKNMGDSWQNRALSVGFENSSECLLPGPERPTLNG